MDDSHSSSNPADLHRREPSVFRIGIRSLLLLLVAMSLLPGFVLVIQNYRQGVTDAQQSLTAELQTVAVLAQSGQENVVAGVRNILETVASGPSVRRDDIRHLCFEFLGNIVTRSGDFANLGFADIRGDMQCIARGVDQKINIADREYFQIASKTRQFTIGGYLVGRVLAVPAMGFSIPVYDYANNFVGVAFATVNLQRVNAALQAMMLRQGLRVDLVDAGGILMGSTASGFGKVGELYPLEIVRDSIVQAASGAEEVAVLQSNGLWIQIREVGADVAGGLYVVASANVDEEFSPFGDRLLRQLVALSAVFATGLFLAWQLGLFFVAKPVSALQRSMNEASTAPHKLSTYYRHRTWELEDLSLGLRSMVERLRQGMLQVERAQKLAGIGFYTFDRMRGEYRIDSTTDAMLSLTTTRGVVRSGTFEGVFVEGDIHALRTRRTQMLRVGGEVRIPMRYLRPDGEQRILEVFELIPPSDLREEEQSAIISGAIQDVTDKVRLQRMYALLGNVNEVGAFSKTPVDLYQSLCEVAVGIGEFKMAWVAERDPDGSGLVPLAVAGDDGGYVELVSKQLVDFERSESPAAAAFRTVDLVVVDDVRQVAEDVWWRSEALQRGFRSIAVAPLLLEGEVVAVAAFMAGSAYHFQIDERRLLVALAASVSTALSHQRARNERERVHNELTVTTSSLLRAQTLVRLGNWTRNATDLTAIWSAGLYEILGRDPLLGPPTLQDARRNVHPDDVELYLSTMNAALRGGTRSRRMRYRCQREDGQWIWLEEIIDEPVLGDEGQILSVSGTVQDVTDQMEGEQRLQLQLSRTELLNQIARATEARHDLESVFAVVCEKLESSFNVDVSAVFRRHEGADMLVVAHLGMRGADVARRVGLQEKSALDASSNGLARCLTGALVHEPDLTGMADRLPRALVDQGLKSLVLIPLQSSGETFGVILVARTHAHSFTSSECEFLHQLGEHVSLAAVHARLIESLKRAYRELEVAQHTALQQERLRLLGQMASGIAHDINNAITPVSLYAEMMLMHEHALSDAGRKQLETIQLAVQNVSQTIGRMRDFYRPKDEASQRSPLQLNKLVMQALDLTKVRWLDQSQMSGIAIEVRSGFVDPCPSILAFEVEVRDAVVNLILNAVDAMPAGGCLSVHTRVVVLAGLDHFEIEVGDTGVGMDEKTRMRAIEPFFTTKGDQGSGLGLAMVFGCMKRHEGEVKIESQVGEGTRVSLLFPMVQGDSPANVEIDRPDVAYVPGRYVLLIDDDPLLLQAVGLMLRRDGHDVQTAASGEAGITAFEERLGDRPFDVVLTDLGMPGIDGRMVALRIKAMSPATPIVMLTGWGRRMNEDDDMPAHVDMVLGKPPQRRDVLEAIEQLTARR